MERVRVKLASAQTLARYACEYKVSITGSVGFTPVILDGGLPQRTGSNNATPHATSLMFSPAAVAV